MSTNISQIKQEEICKANYTSTEKMAKSFDDDWAFIHIHIR